MSSLATTPPVSMGAPARRASTSATPLAAASSLSRSFTTRGPVPAQFAAGSTTSSLQQQQQGNNASSSSSSRPPAVVVPCVAEAATTTVGFSAPMRAPVAQRGPALASPSAAKGLLSSALEQGGAQEIGAAFSRNLVNPSSAPLLSPKTSLFADPTGRSSRMTDEALNAAIDAAAAELSGLAARDDADEADAVAEAAAATRTVDLAPAEDDADAATAAKTATTTLSDNPEALLAAAQRRHEVFRAPSVAAAMRLAARLHAGSAPRASGEPLLAHCVAVASILADLGLGEDLVAAGLLHDALGPRSSLCCSSAQGAAASATAAATSAAASAAATTSSPPSSSSSPFPSAAQLVAGAGDPSCSVPPGVAALVERAERLSAASRLYRDNAHAIAAAQQLDLLTGVDDAAALLVVLADRLADMRDLHHLPRARQVRLARETAGVHSVLASRLGAWRVKAELEDLSFAALQPEQHAAASALVSARAEAADLPSRVREAVEALRRAGVEVVDVSGRVKHARGAAKKLGRGKALDDVAALRVVVPGKHDCYAALRALETLAWPGASVPGRFKDYIRERKANGYQSLHYVVELTSSSSSAAALGAGVEGAAGSAAASSDGADATAAASTVRFEVQIRTPKMHYLAEYGMAAHWRYKEAGGGALDSADGSPSGGSGGGSAAPAREQRLSRGSGGSGGHGAAPANPDPKAAADRAEWLDRLVQWKRWVVAHKLGLATESGKARAAMLGDAGGGGGASADGANAASQLAALAGSLPAVAPSTPASASTSPLPLVDAADAALRSLGLHAVLDAEACPEARARVDPLLLNERFRVRPVTEGDAASRPVPVLVSGPRGARVVELPPRTTAGQLLRAAEAAAAPPGASPTARLPQLELPAGYGEGADAEADAAATAEALERVLVSPAAAAAAAHQRARLASSSSSSSSSRPASGGGNHPAAAPRLASRPRPPAARGVVAVLVNGVSVEAGSSAADAPLRPGDLVSLVAPAKVGAAPPHRVPAYAAAAAAAAQAAPAYV